MYGGLATLDTPQAPLARIGSRVACALSCACVFRAYMYPATNRTIDPVFDDATPPASTRWPRCRSGALEPNKRRGRRGREKPPPDGTNTRGVCCRPSICRRRPRSRSRYVLAVSPSSLSLLLSRVKVCLHGTEGDACRGPCHSVDLWVAVVC